MTFLFQLMFLLTTFFQPVNGRLPAPDLFHPFYVSVTEITQNGATGTLEVSCKFFVDDFEETLRTAYKTKLDFANEKEKATFDQVIPDYINKRLSLVIDGKPVKLSYVGFEKEKESVFCYFEVAGVPGIKTLQAGNTLLHDYKTEQINIMHVSVKGKRQSTKLDYPAREASFSF